MTHVQPNAVPDDTGTSDEEVLHSYSALSVYAHAYSCLSIQPCPFQEPLPITSGGQLQTELIGTRDLGRCKTNELILLVRTVYKHRQDLQLVSS